MLWGGAYHPQRSFCPNADAQGAVISQLFGLSVHSVHVGGGILAARGFVGLARFRVKRRESERRRKEPLRGDIVMFGVGVFWFVGKVASGVICGSLERM